MWNNLTMFTMKLNLYAHLKLKRIRFEIKGAFDLLIWPLVRPKVILNAKC